MISKWAHFSTSCPSSKQSWQWLCHQRRRIEEHRAWSFFKLTWKFVKKKRLIFSCVPHKGLHQRRHLLRRWVPDRRHSIDRLFRSRKQAWARRFYLHVSWASLDSFVAYSTGEKYHLEAIHGPASGDLLPLAILSGFFSPSIEGEIQGLCWWTQPWKNVDLFATNCSNSNTMFHQGFSQIAFFRRLLVILKNHNWTSKMPDVFLWWKFKMISILKIYFSCSSARFYRIPATYKQNFRMQLVKHNYVKWKFYKNELPMNGTMC